MKKNLLAGIVLSSLMLYLSFRGIQFQNVIDGFKNIRYEYIIPVLIIMILMQVLRSFRWGIMLSPMEKIDQLSLFAVTSIGFLAIMAIPARLGELVRPYLITKKSQIKMASALGTILIERLIDALTVMAMLLCSLFFMPLPLWLIESSLVFILIALIFLGMIIFIFTRREVSQKIINTILGIVPSRYTSQLSRLINHLMEGFQIIKDHKNLFYITLLSFLIWLINVLAIYLLFLAFEFNLPPAAAFVLMFVLIIGIAIPAAPGFIGNWHFACVLGLGLFGISKTEALTFAIIYHFLSVGIIVTLGLIFLPFNSLYLTDLRQEFNRGK